MSTESNEKPLAETYLPAGAVVHVEGLPFYLAGPTRLLGHPANVELLGSVRPLNTNSQEAS